MNINVKNTRVREARTAEANDKANRRAQWMRQLRQWHWISGAISLLSMLAFAVTGITLNHAAQIEARPAVTVVEAKLDENVLEELKLSPKTGRTPLPPAVAASLGGKLGIDIAQRNAEWTEDEALISLPRPGGDGWISLDRETGAARYEVTSRGWIAYLNDLHKGRHTGEVWSLFIDAFAIACVVFCVTGLLLMQLYAKGRPSTWPLVSLGVFLPIVLAVLFIH